MPDDFVADEEVTPFSLSLWERAGVRASGRNELQRLMLSLMRQQQRN